MIKLDQVKFKQLQPPLLNKVFSIKHPEEDLIFQHWRHLMNAIEVEDSEGRRNSYLFYKSKYSLAFANFQQGCLLYQKKFKVIYSQSQEITCIRSHMMTIRFNEQKKKQLLISIGFMDGTVEVFVLIVSEKSVILKKLIVVENNQLKKAPVSSIVYSKRHLFFTRGQCAYAYKDFLSVIADMIIRDQLGKSGKDVKYGLVQQKLVIEDLVKGSSLHICPGHQSIYIFNEMEGARSIDNEHFKLNGSITDTFVLMKQAIEQNLILGDTANNLKIIYKSKNFVTRFSGFKNYCSAIDTVLFPQTEQLWIGDLNGCITYFQRSVAQDKGERFEKTKLIDQNVKYSLKVTENGTKQMKICGKMLFILDTQSNIHIFDIVRKDSLQHLKTVQIESVEEYSSNQP